MALGSRPVLPMGSPSGGAVCLRAAAVEHPLRGAKRDADDRRDSDPTEREAVATEALLAWLAGRGAKVEGLAVSVGPLGRGLFTKRRVEPGEVFCQIPEDRSCTDMGFGRDGHKLFWVRPFSYLINIIVCKISEFRLRTNKYQIVCKTFVGNLLIKTVLKLSI